MRFLNLSSLGRVIEVTHKLRFDKERLYNKTAYSEYYSLQYYSVLLSSRLVYRPAPLGISVGSYEDSALSLLSEVQSLNS